MHCRLAAETRSSARKNLEPNRREGRQPKLGPHRGDLESRGCRALPASEWMHHIIGPRSRTPPAAASESDGVIKMDALRKQLVEALKGGDAHTDFDSAVTGFPVQRAGEKPAGAPHTAW